MLQIWTWLRPMCEILLEFENWFFLAWLFQTTGAPKLELQNTFYDCIITLYTWTGNVSTVCQFFWCLSHLGKVFFFKDCLADSRGQRQGDWHGKIFSLSQKKKDFFCPCGPVSLVSIEGKKSPLPFLGLPKSVVAKRGVYQPWWGGASAAAPFRVPKWRFFSFFPAHFKAKKEVRGGWREAV